MAELQRGTYKESGGGERDNPAEMGIRGTYSGGEGRGERDEVGRKAEDFEVMGARERERVLEHDHTLYFLHQALCNTKGSCKIG